MDATLDVKDMELVYFSPYYGDFLSKRKLLSAKLNVACGMKAKDNNLAISVNFRLSDLVYEKEKPKEEGELPRLDLVRNTLDLFTDKQGNLILDFNINTKMDNPEISIAELKKAILNTAIKNLAGQKPEDLEEKATGIIEQFKDFGTQMKELFKKKEEKKQE